MSKRWSLVNAVRLAGYALSYGLTGALVGGTLNRIFIADMKLSATLVGLLFALPLLVAPARVWFGYRSDGYPILGRRREPYILIGATITAAAVVLAVLLAVNLAAGVWALTAGLVLIFALYGIGRSLAHNSYQALVADKFTRAARQRALTLYEVATLLGSVIGAGALGQALAEYSPERLVAVTLGAMAAALALAFVAAVGQEGRNPVTEWAAAKAKEIPFGQALRDVGAADPQVQLFFALIVLTFIGTFAQDAFLEPYGALVLGMDVGATTQLTAFWGVGVLIAMLLCGTLLLRFVNYMLVLRSGLVISALAFAGVIAAGSVESVGLFRGLVFLMGIGTGIAGAGMMAGFTAFATTFRAGLMMGIWGVANTLGRALGSLMGGVVVDSMMGLTGGNAYAAYATVFALEIVMLVAAFVISLRVHIEASRARTEEQQELENAISAAV